MVVKQLFDSQNRLDYVRDIVTLDQGNGFLKCRLVGKGCI